MEYTKIKYKGVLNMNNENEIIKQEVVGESRLIQGECLAVMDRLIAEGIVVDAIITDPPY